MNQDEIVRKNLELHAAWMSYVFEHPEVLEQIPANAQLVIIPNDDLVLAEENTRTAKRLKEKGQPVVIVHMDTPKPPTPQIEVIEAIH